MELTQSIAFDRPFFMVEDSDHITGATGLTITMTISKAGAAFAALGGSVVELSNGWYVAELNTTDTNTVGALAYHATATGADPLDFADQVFAAAAGTQTIGFMQNAVFDDFQFRMTDAAGSGVTGLTDADFTKKEYSLGGGAQGTLSGTITEDPGGEGFYLISFTGAELNARSVALTFLAAGTIATQLTIITNP